MRPPRAGEAIFMVVFIIGLLTIVGVAVSFLSSAAAAAMSAETHRTLANGLPWFFAGVLFGSIGAAVYVTEGERDSE